MLGAKVFSQSRTSGVESGNIAARIIHFGRDDCHRLMVLRSAGYAVEACDSFGQFHAFLAGDEAADAVLLSEDECFFPEDAALLVRSYSEAPVILFRNTNRTCEEVRFDLVVPSLTPPQVWLQDVDAVIVRKRQRAYGR